MRERGEEEEDRKTKRNTETETAIFFSYVNESKNTGEDKRWRECKKGAWLVRNARPHCNSPSSFAGC